MSSATHAGGTAARRMVDTLLRKVAGQTVLLRMPLPAVPNDLGEQLGLATPLFQDAEIGPVAFRRVRATTGTAQTSRATTYELLISPAAITRLMGTLSLDSAELLFAQAAGIVVDDTTYEIVWAASAEAFGSVYLYRLGLRAPVKDLT